MERWQIVDWCKSGDSIGSVKLNFIIVVILDVVVVIFVVVVDYGEVANC